MKAPRYRSDIAGNVREMIADCEASMRGELATAEEFILSADDTGAWVEFADYLTEREMRAAFKRANNPNR